MRRDDPEFSETELELVHIGRRLADSQRLEALLDEEGVDYVIEPEKYYGKLFGVIPVPRIGAFFFVCPDEAERCRAFIRGKGYTIVEVEQESAAEEE